MLTGIHFLLTYTCNFECDHCFLHCGPFAEGTFTLDQIDRVLVEAEKIGTVEWVYFEGGEPFLYYPILLEGLRRASARGYKTGLVSNCYWATAPDDAKVWLAPFAESGINDLGMSDDVFHHGEVEETPAGRAARVAANLGLPVTRMCIEKPTVQAPAGEKGDPVIGGGALFKGRAADKLTEGLPVKDPESFCECPHEELVAPKRVHVDAFGNVHICQGISIGNMWRRPLSKIVADYDHDKHPVSGPLVRGGPAELARVYDLKFDSGFVDECHYCYSIRRQLIDKFPEYLTPRQVYGL